MEREYAKKLLHDAIDALEREPGRWAHGGYVLYRRPCGWCACLLGAAYCIDRFGKLPEVWDHGEEESRLDIFLEEIDDALDDRPYNDLRPLITGQLIDKNDLLCKNGRPLSELRAFLNERIGRR